MLRAHLGSLLTSPLCPLGLFNVLTIIVLGLKAVTLAALLLALATFWRSPCKKTSKTQTQQSCTYLSMGHGTWWVVLWVGEGPGFSNHFSASISASRCPHPPTPGLMTNSRIPALGFSPLGEMPYLALGSPLVCFPFSSQTVQVLFVFQSLIQVSPQGLVPIAVPSGEPSPSLPLCTFFQSSRSDSESFPEGIPELLWAHPTTLPVLLHLYPSFPFLAFFLSPLWLAWVAVTVGMQVWQL